MLPSTSSPNSSSLSLATTWLVEASLKLDSRSQLLKVLGARIPHFWQRIHKHKIWYLTLLTLDNILSHSDRAADIFSKTEFLHSFTHLLEDIFKNNPFLFCGADQEGVRAEWRALLKSLRAVLSVANQRQNLANGLPPPEETSSCSRRGEGAALRKLDEALGEKRKVFWNTILLDSEKTFVNFVGSVLDPPTLGVLHSIRKVIMDNVISGRTRLEAFFERGWEDYVHSDDKIFQGLVDIRRKNTDYNGLTAPILIDVIYLLYAHERKEILPLPSEIPLLDPNKELYVLEISNA